MACYCSSCRERKAKEQPAAVEPVDPFDQPEKVKPDFRAIGEPKIIIEHYTTLPAGNYVEAGKMVASAIEAGRQSEQPCKDDTGKLRLDLIDPVFEECLAKALSFGATKYSPWNWASGEGFSYARIYGALRRHLKDWYSGNDIDLKDSKLPHLYLAAANIMFLISTIERGKGLDDRPHNAIATLTKFKEKA